MLHRGIIFLALLVATSLVLSGCQRRPVAPSSVEPQQQEEQGEGSEPGETALAPASGLPQNPGSITAALKAETERATNLIRELRNDLELVIVAMTFENSFSDLKGLSTNYYIFSTPNDPRFYYMVNVSRDGSRPKRFLMPKEDFEFDFSVIAIPLDQWKINYAQALQAAEQQGGERFRTQYPNFKATATLAIPVTQKLAWYITYRALDGSGATFKVTVDAASGTALVLS